MQERWEGWRREVGGDGGGERRGEREVEGDMGEVRGWGRRGPSLEYSLHPVRAGHEINTSNKNPTQHHKY